ncbi:MAG: glycosyltransferase family 9 protein [Candidatus Hydrogenedentes bacterium]|nr:glycosyltransferase family 9 protein [Candidatus Hydrogenedentota bacterium]
MNILVLQTARIGDTLQTTPLLSNIRKKFPHAHITLMIRSMSEPVAKANPDINDYIIYNEDPIFSDLLSNDSDRLLNAYQTTEKFITELQSRKFNKAYNVTHSTSSALLLKLAEIEDVVGANISSDWVFNLKGAWTVYFFTSVLSRDYNDLNLCDIFKLYEPVNDSVDSLIYEVKKEGEEYARELFNRYSISSEEMVICLQLGASEPVKRWPPEFFAKLAKLIHEKHKARFFLVGVTSEAELGNRFQKEVPGLAIPLFGKTNLDQLAGLLKHSSALITNDTGTMHLAVAVRCPVLLVSVGYVHFRETGPYGRKNIAVELRERSFKMDISSRHTEDTFADKISPEQVFQAFEWLIHYRSQELITQQENSLTMENINVHISEFASDGCLQFLPLIRREITEKDFLRLAYREMWIESFGTSIISKNENLGTLETLKYYKIPQDTITKDWSKEFSAIFEELAKKYKQGIYITEQIRHSLANKNISKAKEQVKLLTEIDEQIRIFSEINPYLKPLTNVTKFERDNLEGNNPLELCKQTLNIYKGGYERSSAMGKKVKHIIEKMNRIKSL